MNFADKEKKKHTKSKTNKDITMPYKNYLKKACPVPLTTTAEETNTKRDRLTPTAAVIAKVLLLLKKRGSQSAAKGDKTKSCQME